MHADCLGISLLIAYNLGEQIPQKLILNIQLKTVGDVIDIIKTIPSQTVFFFLLYNYSRL